MGLVRRDGIIMTVYSYVGAVLGAVNKILLFPNFLLPEQIGLANVLLALSAVYAQVSAFGSNMYIVKFFPYFKDKEKQHNGLFFWALITGLIGFSLSSILFIVFKPGIAHYYSKNSHLLNDYYFYIIPMAISALLISMLDGYLRMLYKNTVIQFLNEVLSRLFITISIVVYIVHWINFDQFVIVYAGLYSLVGFIAIAYTIYLKQFFIKPIISMEIKRFKKQIISYATYIYLSSMSNAFLNNIDVLLVTGIASLASTGIYTTVFFITTVMQIPYKAITKAASSKIAYYWKRKELIEIQKLYVQVSEVSFVVGGGLFLILWVNLKNIFSFMPPIYSTGTVVFLLVAFGRLFDIASGLNGYILVFSNKYRIELLFTFILIASSFALNNILIPIMGINGAALTTCIVLLGYNSMRLWYVWYHYKLFPFHRGFILPVIWLLILSWGSWYTPRIINVYFDIIIKSAVACVFFFYPIYLIRFSEDINKWVNKHLNQYIIKQ